MKTLVVDDEFVSLTKLTTLFSAYGQCDAATNAFQAIEMYRKACGSLHPYELVTIDVEMREMNGLTLLKQLRDEDTAKEGHPAKKIIISAASRPETVKQAVLNKCDAFLVKPILRDALAAKLFELDLITKEQSSTKELVKKEAVKKAPAQKEPARKE